MTKSAYSSNRSTAPSLSSGRWQQSSRKNPCPICGRTKDGDCRKKDGILYCFYGSTHRPPKRMTLKIGDVHNGLAYIGDTREDSAVWAMFKVDQPIDQATGRVVPIKIGTKVFARINEIIDEPPASLPDGMKLFYTEKQFVLVKVYRNGEKKLAPRHINEHGKVESNMGVDPWPFYHQDEAIKHGRGKWIIETEGEKCADWVMAGGFVAITHPGFNMTEDSMERRYRELKEAGIIGVKYLADNDETGRKKADQCRSAAKKAGIGFVVIHATSVWPDIPEKGSIDDAPGTAKERVEAFIQIAATAVDESSDSTDRQEACEKVIGQQKRHRLAIDEVMEELPKRIPGIRLNIRSRFIETSAGTMTGDQISRAYLRLNSKTEVWPKEATSDALVEIADQNSYDPVLEYLESIECDPLTMEQWDNLDKHMLGIEDSIAKAFLPRYLVSAVARTFEPGCGVRQTPVLIGPQWRGKTALGRILFGGDHWVEGLHGRNEVDQRTRCHTAWGVELSELDGITKRADQESLKAFLTERVDVLRRAYGKGEDRLARRFVFWGTSNGPPLRDSTGSSRFVCINIPDKMLPLEWTEQNRDAIWARALEQYKSGFDWDSCNEKERKEIEERNLNFTEVDPWAEDVSKYLIDRLKEKDAKDDKGLPVKISDILKHLGLSAERRSNAMANRVRRLVEACGWRQERRKVDGEDRRIQGFWPSAMEEGRADEAWHNTCHSEPQRTTARCGKGKPSQGQGSGDACHSNHTEMTKVEIEVVGSDSREGPGRRKETFERFAVVAVANPTTSLGPQGIWPPQRGVATVWPAGCPGVASPQNENRSTTSGPLSECPDWLDADL